jgi:hypothetical protein
MIRPVKEVAKESFKSLKKYQSGEITPIRTGREWLDSIFGGLLPGDICTIAGASGAGKSFEEQRIKNFVMSIKNNPEAKDFVWLGYSLEMRHLSTVLRDLKEVTGKSKKAVLTQEFTEEEKQLVNDYYKNMTDGRFFIEEDVITPDEFKKGLVEFLEIHKDKPAVFVSLDHIALFKGMDKKAAIDTIIEIINEVRKTYKNTYWFILSQLNRDILRRIKDKDIIAKPNRGDVFQSDTMFFISDYLYVAHNPHQLGMREFLKVNVKQYDYLLDHFSEIKDGKGSFDTVGKMFYIVLKLREGGSVYRDIYIENVDEIDKSIYEEPKKDEQTFNAPVFESEALREARGEFDDF